MHACELKLLKYRTDPNALEISLPYGGITFADSTNGAVAVISTKKSSGTYDYVILDNATVMRGDADTIQSYVNTFDDLPDHMNLRSAPETLSVYRDWQSLWDVTSKAQDGAVVLIPGTSIYNGLWLDCFENYQNPVRLDSIVDGGVASLQIDIGEFEDGAIKMCLLPEYFAGRIWSDYHGAGLLLKVMRPSANVISFNLMRHWATGGSGTLSLTPEVITCAYDSANPQPITVQMNDTRATVFYGNTELFTEVTRPVHNLSSQLYQHGVFVHVEYEHDNPVVAESATLRGIRCDSLSEFGIPE